MESFSVGGVLLIVLLQTLPVWSQYTSCGGNLTAPIGVIQSPNYPAAYPNNARCHWTISVAGSEIIDLRFTRLDLDGKSYQGIWSPATCPDFVDIYDGDSTTSPLLKRMCRYMYESELASVYIRSTRNKMHIYFESDNSAARTGFLASYWTLECAEFTYGPQKCNMTCNCIKENTASCNSINGTCNCKKGWTGADCSTDVNECQTSLVELCPDYQECHNTAGGFECRCRPGLQMNDSGHCEAEVGSLCKQRQCSHLCAEVSSQSLQEQCYCPNYMQLQGDTCQACDNIHFGKDCHLRCYCPVNNTESCDSSTGGCVCKEGWTSDTCSKDINECQLLNSVCKQNENCVNTPGGYQCIVIPGCNYTMSDPSGIIKSPSYPNKYTSGLRCNWIISSKEADVTLLLRFSDFEIEGIQNCVYDYVDVYDGNNASAPLLGRFCAQPNPIRSTGNSMYIHFHTDTSVEKRGFNGTYITLGLESYRFTETAPTGNIASPGYPYGNRKNTFSYWTITVASNSVIAFNITDMDLEDSLNCEHHYVEFYDGSYAGNTLLGHYCNWNRISDWIFSTGNNMAIIFSSNGSLSKSGFEGNYLTSACKCNRYGNKKSCNSPFSPCNCTTGWEGSDCSSDIGNCAKNICPDYSMCYNYAGYFLCYCRNGSLTQPTDVCDTCNTTLTSPSGHFSTPGSLLYNWYQYILCSWTIAGARDTVVSLRFSYFNVREWSNCPNASVQIYDGSNPNSPLLGQYCGKFVPSLLRSSGNSMHIVMQLSSDYGVFNASYYTHACRHLTYGERCENDCRCNGDHTQHCDNIYGLCKCKPGWTGPSCLDDINECKHENVCPANSECLNTQGSYICDCKGGYVKDAVTGLCKESSNCTKEDRENRSHLYILVNTTAKCPENMKLDVDGKICLGCGGNLTAPSGVIQSPNYPAAYPNSARCHWTISAAGSEIIDLRFSRLDLGGKSYESIQRPATCPDFVDIYDGDSTTSPLLMRMCRYMNESELTSVYIRSTRNKMLIYFESDYEVTRTGFLASYHTFECAEFTYGAQKCNMTCNCKKENTVSCNSINGTCNCKNGWTGADCSTDINECQTSLVELCPDYQECHNTAGSFECHCRSGLQMNASGHCEVEVGALCIQRQCSHLCAKISSQSPQEQCYCPNNMKLQRDTCQACDNIYFGKDCRLKCNCSVTNTKSCDSSTGGCVCKEGWTSDNCSEDINECQLPNSVCNQQVESCVNTPGGYHCLGCNFTMSDPSGIIKSPSYPNRYTSGLRCNWAIISKEADTTILLRFSDFDIRNCWDARQNCLCDYVDIYDGNSASAPLLGRFCAGQRKPIRSIGNSMYINFYTNKTTTGGRGFNGTYITLGPESYRFTETALTGNIVSPGYPYGNRKNTFSYWTITVAPGSVIAFNITDLDLEDSLNCENHYVEFYDGTHAGNRLLGHYCNQSKISGWIFSSGNNMAIIFSSNGSLSKSGFAGNYLTSACKCNRNYGLNSCNSPFSPCTCITGWEGSDCSKDTRECAKNMCPDLSKCYNYAGSFKCYCRNGSLAQPTEVCDSCNTTLTSPSGHFSSPGSPLYKWYQYMFCSWTITGTKDTVVSFRFPYFNVKEWSNCYSATVKIYDGGDPKSPLLGQYCGKFIPSLLRSSGNSMHIVIQLSYDSGVFNASYYTHACHHLTYGERCEKDCQCSGDHTQHCDNIYGLCKCKPGWTGPSCLDDINECKHENVCPANSECQNIIGGYICDCNSGYVKDVVTGLCKESSNYSTEDRKRCSHLCISVNNKAKCVCPENMKLDVDGKTCFVELYPHGEKEAGDAKLVPSNSTNSFNKLHNKIPYVGPLIFSTGIPVGNAHTYESKVYILLNGVIAFNDIQNIPLTPDFNSLDIGKSKMVAALWTNVADNGGEMLYHLYEKCNASVFQEGGQDMKSPLKSEVMMRAARDIAEFYNFSQFDVSTALVVTWKAIPNNCSPSKTNKNTFQAILVSGHGAKTDHYSDEETSYVIFIYQADQISGLCKPGQPIEVGVVTDSIKNQPTASFFGQLDKVTGNTGYKGVMTFKVGHMDNPQVKCQSYICKYSYLLSDQIYQAEIEELYKCPCSLDQLGLQWQLYTDTGSVRCYIIGHVAKQRLLGNNKRNRLCCYTWTQPLSNIWQDMRASVLKGSYLPESHVLISDPWSNPNSDVYHNANENMNAHQWCCDESPRKQCDRFYKIFPEGGCTKNPVFVPDLATST